tara:strand:- start:6908 stop:7933 length:1026 start_codon:yes stop_codon:yes gene_type:complete
MTTFNNQFFGTNHGNKTQSLDMGVISETFQNTKGMAHTFGIEIECLLPYDADLTKLQRMNVACVRDGSIQSMGGHTAVEFVTGVLTGDRGVKQLKAILKELNKQGAKVNRSCGIHVHIGGASFNRQFSANAIRLGYQLQDELYSMMPPSRQNNSYCKKISDNIGWNTREQKNETIANYVFGAVELNNRYNKKCDLGRYPSNRYSWLNLVRCNTASRGETIEFRLHSGTTDFKKIFNWLLICMSITNFAENNEKQIWRNEKHNTYQGGKYRVSLWEVLICSMDERSARLLINYCNRRCKIMDNPTIAKRCYYKHTHGSFSKFFRGIKIFNKIAEGEPTIAIS